MHTPSPPQGGLVVIRTHTLEQYLINPSNIIIMDVDYYINSLKKCARHLLNEINIYENMKVELDEIPEAKENLEREAKKILAKGLLIHERQQEISNEIEPYEL